MAGSSLAIIIYYLPVRPTAVSVTIFVPVGIWTLVYERPPVLGERG
jgi:hypothetical protein